VKADILVSRSTMAGGEHKVTIKDVYQHSTVRSLAKAKTGAVGNWRHGESDRWRRPDKD